MRITGIFLIGVLFIISCGRGCGKQQAHRELPFSADSCVAPIQQLVLSIDRFKPLKGYSLQFPEEVKSYYFQQKGKPLWLAKILIQKTSDEWFSLLFRMEDHGLNSKHYHTAYLGHMYQKFKQGMKPPYAYDSLALFEILLTDASISMYKDLRQGRVSPNADTSPYTLPLNKMVPLDHFLHADSLIPFCLSAEPRFPMYQAAMKEYKRLRQLKDTPIGWINIPNNMKWVKKGDPVPMTWLMQLQKRLKLLGRTEVTELKDPIYSQSIVFHIQELQKDYGLKPDGTIGNATIAVLNKSYDQLLRSAKLTLERWRWMGEVKRNNGVWVNLAANRLWLFREDTLYIQMKVCTGEARTKAYYRKKALWEKDPEKNTRPDIHETPIILSQMTHLTVNPTWFVPRNIVLKEMLQQLVKDPGLLDRMGYVVRNSRGEEIDPMQIDWARLGKDKMPYRFEQVGGENNSLGLVVFHFPNGLSIFMHDTPFKGAFGLDNRHVSHGCIRLERPFELAEQLYKFQEKSKIEEVRKDAGLPPLDSLKRLKWEKQRKEALDKGDSSILKPEIKRDQYFRFNKPIPVSLVYFTMDIGISGKPVYWNDGYKRDLALEKRMLQ